MFGFSTKTDAVQYGREIAERSLTYIEPVHLAITALYKIVLSQHPKLSEEHSDKSLPYELIIHGGTTACELLLFQFRQFSFNEAALRVGFLGYFDDFAEANNKKLGLNIAANHVTVAAIAEEEIRTNTSYKQTGRFMGEKSDLNCLYFALIRNIARHSVEKQLAELSVKYLSIEKGHHTLLEATEGLDRSYRWLEKTSNPKRIRGSKRI